MSCEVLGGCEDLLEGFEGIGGCRKQGIEGL